MKWVWLLVFSYGTTVAGDPTLYERVYRALLALDGSSLEDDLDTLRDRTNFILESELTSSTTKAEMATPTKKAELAKMVTEARFGPMPTVAELFERDMEPFLHFVGVHRLAQLHPEVLETLLSHAKSDLLRTLKFPGGDAAIRKAYDNALIVSSVRDLTRVNDTARGVGMLAGGTAVIVIGSTADIFFPGFRGRNGLDPKSVGALGVAGMLAGGMLGLAIDEIYHKYYRRPRLLVDIRQKVDALGPKDTSLATQAALAVSPPCGDIYKQFALAR